MNKTINISITTTTRRRKLKGGCRCLLSAMVLRVQGSDHQEAPPPRLQP